MFKFWFGVSGMVLLTALAIYVSNQATSNIAWKAFFGNLLPFGVSFITAAVLVFIWGVTAWAVRAHLGRMLNDTAFILNEATHRLAGRPAGSDNGLLPRMEGAMNTLREGLDLFKGFATTESLAKKHLIAFSDDPEDALHKLVDGLVDDNNDINSLRITATMRGVYGRKTYELGKYIVEYLARRIDAGKTTLKDIRVLAPRNSNPPATEANLKLYPVCARHFALHVILSARPVFDDLSAGARSDRLPLVIRLSFSGDDIFPAWHLWCNRRLVILPSLGYEDHAQLSVALPIAIMAADHDGTNLSRTFTRLTRHFDTAFESGYGGGNEQWMLGSDLSIKTHHVARGATPDCDADDNHIVAQCPKWTDIISGNECVLTEKEASDLRDLLAGMAFIA